MTKEELISQITSTIRANGNQDITGTKLQEVLVSIVDTLYSAIDEAIIDASPEDFTELILQSLGTRVDATMSQKAITDALTALNYGINAIPVFARIERTGSESISLVNGSTALPGEIVYVTNEHPALKEGFYWKASDNNYYTWFGDAHLYKVDVNTPVRYNKLFECAEDGKQYVIVAGSTTAKPSLVILGADSGSAVVESNDIPKFNGVIKSVPSIISAVAPTYEGIYFSEGDYTFVAKLGTDYYASWDTSHLYKDGPGVIESRLFEYNKQLYMYDGKALNLLSNAPKMEGYTYISTATPSTIPAALTGDEKVFYIATEEGYYSKFGLGNISELSIIKSDGGTWIAEGLRVPAELFSIKSVGSISLYKGISTSSVTNYPLSSVIPANKEAIINFTIENNAIPKGVVYFRGKNGNDVANSLSFSNGKEETITFSQDIYYIGFSLTDSTITGTGDIIVEFSSKGKLSKINDDVEQIVEKTEEIEKLLKVNMSSQGSISLYKGISTSSTTNYTLSSVIPANKEVNVSVTIENNAIPKGAVYFRDKNGNNVANNLSFSNGTKETITFSQDIYYIGFSLTDSTITGTGDIIVEFSYEYIKFDESISEVKNSIQSIEDTIGELSFHSQGSISLYQGISTSMIKLYTLSQVVPANKEVNVSVTIENNAIPRGAVYFRDSSENIIGSYTFVNGSNEIMTFNRDVHYVSFSLTDSTITGTGDIIVGFAIDGEINKNIANLEKEVDILTLRIDNLQSATSQSLTGGTLSKEIIQTTRPYYFSQGWEDNQDFGYLDSVLATLPEGKNFLLFSDIHLDYYNNWGLLQKQAMIMKYVHDRLKGCKVLFLGDFIGSQPTEIRAQKEMKWFADEYYSLFGDGFIPVLGDHDTDRVNGGLEDGNQLTEQYIQDTYFKPAYRYGAVSDKAISVIDNLSLTDSKKEAWKNFLKMHYYVDDAAQKIRFIVVQNAAIFREIPNANNISGVNLPFVANAMTTLPNDYDCVIVSHEFNIGIEEKSINTSAWMGSLAKLCKSFKSRTSTALSVPYMNNDELIMVFNALKGYYPYSFDFSDKNGNILLIQGDEHIDYAGYVINAETHTGLPISPTDNDFLQLFIDRACVIENKGFPESQFPDKEYVVKTMRRGKSGNFIGTTDEVLFDIATINENTITLTRVGSSPVAGKVGEYEVFDKSKSYSIGDIVVWWGMIENTTSYQIYAYRFIASHIGEWSDNDVEVIDVNEPYIRQYYL